MQRDSVRRFQPRRGIATFLGAGLIILTAALGFAQESPQRDVFFGETHVQRVFIGFGEHRGSFNPHLAQRAGNSNRNLAAIRNKNFADHFLRFRLQ